ncbi:MAG: hypothetical protein AAB443_00910 [Patescibacteria group bacterium]
MTFKENGVQKVLYFCCYTLFFLSLIQLFNHIGNRELDLNLFYNSDSLSHPVIFKDLFEDGFSYSGWMFSDSPAFFPDFLFYSFFRIVTGNFLLASLLNSLAIFLLIFVFFDLLLREIVNQNSYLLRSFALLIGTLLSVLMGVGKGFLFFVLFLSPDFHVGTLAISVCSLVLVMIFLRGGKKRYLYLLFFISLLVGIFDRLWVIHFVAPIMLASTLLFMLGKNYRLRLLYMLVVVLSSFLLGWLIYKVIVPFPTSPSLKLDIAVFLNLLRDIRLLLTSKYLTINVASVDYRFKNTVFPFVWVIIITFFSSLALILKKILKKEFLHVLTTMDFFLIFYIFLVICDFLGTVVSGQYVALTHSRYFTPLFIYSMISFLVFLHFLINRLQKTYIAMLWVFLIVNQLLLIKPGLSTNSFKSYKSLVNYRPQIVDCLDRAKETYELKYGLADYWNAHQITMFSITGLRVYQIHTYYPSPNPYHWNNNVDWYLGDLKSKYEKPTYNFVLPTRLNEEYIRFGLGEPYKKIYCSSQEVWLYSGDTEERVKYAISPRVLFRQLRLPGNKLLMNGDELNSVLLDPYEILRASQTAKVGNSLVADNMLAKPGNVVLGPYFYIENGIYKFTLLYNNDALQAQGGPVLTISKNSKPNFLKLPLWSTKSQDRKLEGYFQIASSKMGIGRLYRTEDIQFKIYHSGNSTLKLISLELERVR